MRLVHEVVPAAELDRRCERMVEALLQAAPGALAEAKRLIRDVGARHGEASRAAVSADDGPAAARACACRRKLKRVSRRLLREAQAGVGVPALDHARSIGHP